MGRAAEVVEEGAAAAAAVVAVEEVAVVVVSALPEAGAKSELMAAGHCER